MIPEKPIEEKTKSLDVETFQNEDWDDGNEMIPTESIISWKLPQETIDRFYKESGL